MLLLLHQRAEASSATLILFSALFLMAPTVHPWYLTWLVPLAVIHSSRAMLLWSGTVVLAYAAVLIQAHEGQWREPVSVRLLEYLPVFIVLAVEVRQRLVGSGSHPLLWESRTSD